MKWNVRAGGTSAKSDQADINQSYCRPNITKVKILNKKHFQLNHLSRREILNMLNITQYSLLDVPPNAMIDVVGQNRLLVRRKIFYIHHFESI